MTDLTREQTIALFQSEIEKVETQHNLIKSGTIKEPTYSLQISDLISLLIGSEQNPFVSGTDTSGNIPITYFIKIIFGGFVDYKSFPLQKHEYSHLVISFEDADSKILQEKKKDIISKGEQALTALLN